MAELKFNCPVCQQPLEAPDNMTGEMICCPGCEESITVPGTKPRKYTECPFCAEQILFDAIKCRFCGEFVDNPTRQQPAQPVIVKEKGEGCFLQTMNIGCVVIIGIILLFVFIGLFAKIFM